MIYSTIHKYPIHFGGKNPVDMPEGAQIISVGHDPEGRLCVWALVDPTNPMRPYAIHVYGTGFLVPDAHTLRFLATVNEGPFMWHIFCEGEK